MPIGLIRRVCSGIIASVLLAGIAACGGEPSGEPARVVVPRGASLHRVADSLAAQGVIGEREKSFFRLYARLKRDDRGIHAGQYEFRPGQGWGEILSDLTAGRVITVRLTVPEGFTLARMAPRLAAISGISPDTVLAILSSNDSLTEHLGLPGPGLEGYLFPDTYLFEPGAELLEVLSTMAQRYRAFWTPERRARLEDLNMTEREAVTLASIIQAEAIWNQEMPQISSVYHNRLRIGYALYADPTVLYALGGHRERLLYAAIDSVADNPYNTYRHAGLPPGPIGSPGEHALEAALNPAETGYYYFVARPDGFHVFTTSLEEHNVAKARAQREWAAARSAVGVRGPEMETSPGVAPSTPANPDAPPP